jgi:hypothetical protein
MMAEGDGHSWGLSLIGSALGLSDSNPSVRGDHIKRVCNIIDVAAEIGALRNLMFCPRCIFGGKLVPRE